MEMTKNRTIAVSAVVAALALAALHLFIYQPLLKKIQDKAVECRLLEPQVEQARRNVAILAIKGREKSFIEPDEIASAIEELTQRGRAKGVTFLSITPRQIEKTSENYQMLPIDMETESSYQAMGNFLGGLDALEKCLVTVRNFDMVPLSDKTDKIRTRLTMNMHLRD